MSEFGISGPQDGTAQNGAPQNGGAGGFPSFITMPDSETATLLQGSFPTEAFTDPQGATSISILETTSQLPLSSPISSLYPSSSSTASSAVPTTSLTPTSSNLFSSTSGSSTMSAEMKETASPNIPLTNSSKPAPAGLSTGAKIAIGVTVPVVSLLILAALLFALYRWHRRNNHNSTPRSGGRLPGMFGRLGSSGDSTALPPPYTATNDRDVEQIGHRDFAPTAIAPGNGTSANVTHENEPTGIDYPTTPTIPTNTTTNEQSEAALLQDLREAGIGAAFGRTTSGIGATTYAPLGDPLPPLSSESSREPSRPNTPPQPSQQHFAPQPTSPPPTYQPYRSPSVPTSPPAIITPPATLAPPLPRTAPAPINAQRYYGPEPAGNAFASSPYAIPPLPFETPTHSMIAANASFPFETRNLSFQPNNTAQRPPVPLSSLDTGVGARPSLHPYSGYEPFRPTAFDLRRQNAVVSAPSSSSFPSTAMSDSHSNDPNRHLSQTFSNSQEHAFINNNIQDTDSPIAPMQTASAIPFLQHRHPSQTNIPKRKPLQQQVANNTVTSTLALAQSPVRTPTLPTTTVSATAPPRPYHPVPMPVAAPLAPELGAASSPITSNSKFSQSSDSTSRSPAFLLTRKPQLWSPFPQDTAPHENTTALDHSPATPSGGSSSSGISPITRSAATAAIISPASTSNSSPRNNSASSKSSGSISSLSSATKRVFGLGIKRSSDNNSNAARIAEEHYENEHEPAVAQAYSQAPRESNAGYWKDGMWHGPPRVEREPFRG